MNMKKLIRIVALLSALIVVPMEFFAAESDQKVVVKTYKSTPPKDTPPDVEVDDFTEGCRMPQNPVFVSIDRSDGVYVPGVSKEEIYLFEIFAEGHSLIGSFADEDDFIMSLFSMNGTYEIKIYLNDYVLRGWVYL